MSQFRPITRSQHRDKAWRRIDGYAFAAKDAIVPIGSAELSVAAAAMPLAFTQQHGHFVLVAVQSLEPNRNLFVAPDGKWLGAYIPALLRAYPFRMMRQEGNNDRLFCIDVDANTLCEPAPGAEPIFQSDGDLAPGTKAVFDFLAQIERNNAHANMAIAALADAGVIQPWPIKLKLDNIEQTVRGLHRVDEARMNGLDDQAFLRLRKAGALPIAYAQLLSTSRLTVLEGLARIQLHLMQAAKPAPAPIAAILPDTLDKIFDLPGGDMIKFD